MPISAPLDEGDAADPRFVLEAVGLSKTFRRKRGFFGAHVETYALRDASIEVKPREILAVVGESGSGKTTLGKIIVGAETPDRGAVRMGQTTYVDRSTGVFVPPSKRGIGMIFQDPYSAINPRMRIRDIVGEGLQLAGVRKSEIAERAAQTIERVGLRTADLDAYPHQFSGGQRQRIGVARALIMQPKLLIADEATSSLDVSVQIQILNLLLDIRDAFDLAMVFITHNIGVVEYLCDRVAVMWKGEIVETGSKEQIISAPQHPYTSRLLDAAPRL